MKKLKDIANSVLTENTEPKSAVIDKQQFQKIVDAGWFIEKEIPLESGNFAYKLSKEGSKIAVIVKDRCEKCKGFKTHMDSTGTNVCPDCDLPPEALMENKPDYYDQLKIAYNKARKEKNVEAMAYYEQLLKGGTAASVPFERFKGSWAYEEWLKKPETIELIQAIKDEFKRFSYLNENDMFDGNLLGLPTHTGGIVTPGSATFNSPDVQQHPTMQYPVGQNKVDWFNSNAATGPTPEDVKKLKHKVTPDEIIQGVDAEMKRMFNKNKSRAKAIVVNNLKQDPKYYSKLHFMGIEGGDEQITERKSIKESFRGKIDDDKYNYEIYQGDNCIYTAGTYKEAEDFVNSYPDDEAYLLDIIPVNKTSSHPTLDYIEKNKLKESFCSKCNSVRSACTCPSQRIAQPGEDRVVRIDEEGSWPGGKRHAMDQGAHEKWNASHYPGTRQLCFKCDEPTGQCEEDAIYDEDGNGPYCMDCYHKTDEYINSNNVKETSACGIISGKKCQKCGIHITDETADCQNCKTGMENYPMNENVNIAETKKLLDAMIEQRKSKTIEVNKNITAAYQESIDRRDDKRNRFYEDRSKVNLSEKLKKEIL